MSTVGDLIGRINRTILYPPNMQPALAFAANALDADVDDDQLTISAFAIPEDEQLLRVGSLLELDRELVRVTAYNPATKTCTVNRAAEDTTLAVHAANAKVVFEPMFPRQDVFNAVSENITSLFPRLYTVRVETVTAVAPGIAGIEDPLAVSIESVWDDSRSNTVDFHGEIIDYHPAVGGRAVVTNAALSTMWVRYRRRFGTATAESDTYVSLGLDPQWVNVVRIGAAADLLVGRDVSDLHISFIGQSLESEIVRPGTKTSIAIRLAQYRDLLLDRYGKEMNAEYRPKIAMQPWRNNLV